MAARLRAPGDFAVQALALLASVVLVHGLYVTVVWPRSESALAAQHARMQVDPNYVQDRSIWVILRDYEQESEIILMLWALAIIAHKARLLKREGRLLDRDLVALGEGMRILPQDAREHARHVEALPEAERDTLLPRVMRSALNRFGATGSIADASAAARTVFEGEADRLDSELSLLRYIAWAIPAIGFIGTVRGIGDALAQAHRAMQGDLSGVTQGLGTAFNSTLVALLLSLVLMFLLHHLQGEQDRLVREAESYLDSRVLQSLRGGLMAALALEVNDAGLQLLREGRPRPEVSPGLALFEDGAVLIGAAAAARAALRPRSVHDRYFDPLDTEPLGAPFPAGIRRADLAHAHLSALADGARPGDEAFLAVPGFWSAEGLGLLLGVAGAAGLHVAGLVDAAVAAASLFAGAQPRLHVDLTRHRLVVSVLSGGAELERTEVVGAEGLGLRSFEDALVGAIAGIFVDETRFDPLHSGVSEQALRDALPGWLRELRRENACEASLESAGRKHRATLTRAALAQATLELQRALASQARALVPAGEVLLMVSARASGVPGLTAQLSEATGLPAVELPYDSAVAATLRRRERLRHAGPALPFVTRLPPLGVAAPHAAGEEPPTTGTAGDRPA